MDSGNNRTTFAPVVQRTVAVNDFFIWPVELNIILLVNKKTYISVIFCTCVKGFLNKNYQKAETFDF